MEQRVQHSTFLYPPSSYPDLGGGLVTFANPFAVPHNATMACMDVKFGIGGTVEKRLGSTTMNATAIVAAIATGFTPDVGGTLTTSLNVFWRLDEQTGTRLDALGSLNLTAVNTVGFGSGVFGNAATFVAANSTQLLRANNSSLTLGSGAFSMSCWVNLTSKTLDQTFISKYVSANTAQREYRLWYDARVDRFRFAARGGATETIITESSLGSPSTATWYLLTAQVNSAASYILIRANTFLAQSASFTVTGNTTTAPFLLGAANTSSAFEFDTGGNLLSSLVAYWRMEEASGTRLDATGRGNNLASNGSNNVAVLAGRVDSAAQLTLSSGHFLSITSATDVQTGNVNFTVSAWVYLDTTPTTDTTICSKSDEATAGYREYVFTYQSAGQFAFTIYPSAGGVSSVTATAFGAAGTATWIFVMAWYDSAAATVNIQVNNGTINSAAASANGPASTQATFRIGAERGTQVPTVFFWNGRIDEVGFWKRTLSNNERADLYYAGSGNRYSTDYVNGRIDEVGLWRKNLITQEVIDLWNSNGGNTYRAAVGNSGFGMFDFGAGFGADGLPLRWLIVAAGTGIFASSNRGLTFVTIATDRGADFQSFERSKSLLIATSNTQNKVLYWAGSAGTFMAALAVGSAPPTKHALDFGGFLLTMNDSSNKRLVTYADNTKLLTDPWTTTFEIPSSLDDEITGGLTYNRSAYVYTKYTVSRVTAIGGNPDFAVQNVKSWGAVPGTIKRATYKEIGEVMISLGYDRHVRIFDGTDDQIISTPIEEPNGISEIYLQGIPVDTLQRCKAEVDTEEQTYRLLFAMTPSTQTTHTICLNLRTGAWYPYRNQQTFNNLIMAESGNSRILTGVTRDGFLHWINTTNTDNGVAIPEYYDLPLIYNPLNPRTLGKVQKMALYFFPTSSGPVYYQERVNFASAYGAARHLLQLTDTSTVTQIRQVIDVPVMQNVYQARLSSSGAATTPWKLTRMDYERTDLGVGAA